MTLANDYVIISIILELKFPVALYIFAPKGSDKMNKQIVNDDRLMTMHASALKAYLEMLVQKNYY